MLVSSRFGLRDVSEKSIEVNVLNELASFLWSNFNLCLTAISPTQIEEDRLGFDDIIEGLPPGIILAVQFKRPYKLTWIPDAAKFIVQTQQLAKLASKFSRGEAFLFLTPLPTNDMLIKNRLHLLKLTAALDVHRIPNVNKTTQRTRTIRIRVPLSVEITDPRKYFNIPDVPTVAQLSKMISTGDVGHKIPERPVPEERRERIKMRRLYYLHIAPIKEKFY